MYDRVGGVGGRLNGTIIGVRLWWKLTTWVDSFILYLLNRDQVFFIL